MTIKEFPNVEYADPETGLLAIGGDLMPESLLLAYRNGIFPWPQDEKYLLWFAPAIRTILFLDDLHISHSLQKFLKHNPFSCSIDQAFPEVISKCAEVINRGDQDGTWITPQIISAYTTLHQCGYAHSIECWDENHKLVGGLYGVSINHFFAGESMFHRQTNASKVALIFLCQHLQELGVKWIDCQMTTPLFKSFGAKEISRQDYMQLLKTALT